jgi:leucyl-tRNA---protein transferase
MRIFLSQCRPEYGTYTFPYAVYCVPESRAELPEVYARGFLPYTGQLSLDQDVFYLARSLRVDLSRFADTSENRRVDRKAAELGIGVRAVPLAEFDTEDPHFRDFCREYAEERFRGGTMSEERLAYVLGRGILSHLLLFESDTRRYGYVFAARAGDMLHYWYSFFDTEYLRSHSLGKWMMWRTLRLAAEEGLRHVYLGTCYGEKALYKARDHTGVEFWDGNRWSGDLGILKTLCRLDDDPGARDRDLFKLEEPALAPIFEGVR